MNPQDEKSKDGEPERPTSSLAEDLMRLAKSKPPVIDPRPIDELLGYGPDGLPH